MKRKILASLLMIIVVLTGCKAQDSFKTVTVPVIDENQFGSVYVDLHEIDLEYGDSVNLSFSGGYHEEHVPFYPDFYGAKGTTILTDFNNEISVAGINCNFNSDAHIQIGETLTITLDERGRYREDYEAYNLDPDLVKWEGQTDEEFINSREITAGNIRPGILYRGASPFDTTFNRTDLMDRFIRDNNIQFIFDLADDNDKIRGLEGLPENTSRMINENRVYGCYFGIDYADPVSMAAFGEGLKTMMDHEGPYLIHCSLGRDRTGILCAIIEALCGATYDEIVDDYMLSYRDLHHIDMDPSSLQYNLFKQRLLDKLEEALQVDQDSIATADLQSASHDYLIRCGMTEEEVARLIDTLT
ncbi:MAG: tyrosine-protein phosphatase [Clostridiales bacterium]|nr:tyrosine-protein phosphatase [Clostridiales bacterium]